MEGLYVRFKETDHPIWIGTQTAVAPDVDESSITLHFEPSRESISSDCVGGKLV